MRAVLAAVVLCAVPLPAGAQYCFTPAPAVVQAYYVAPVDYPVAVPAAAPVPVAVQAYLPLPVPACAPPPIVAVPLAVPAPVAPVTPRALPVPAPAAPPAAERSPAPPESAPIRRYYAPPTERTARSFEPAPDGRPGPGRNGNTVALTFRNQSDDTMVLTLDGMPYLLVAGKDLTLTARREFTWQVEGREPERHEVPPGEKGETIVLRR